MTTPLHLCPNMIQPVTHRPDETETAANPRLFAPWKISEVQEQNSCLQPLDELSLLILENIDLITSIKNYNFSIKKSEESVRFQTVSVKALDSTILCAEIGNEKLKKDISSISSLGKANNELLNRTKDSENKHLSMESEKLISRVPIPLLWIAMRSKLEHSAVVIPRNKWAASFDRTYHPLLEWTSTCHALQQNLARGKQYAFTIHSFESGFPRNRLQPLKQINGTHCRQDREKPACLGEIESTLPPMTMWVTEPFIPFGGVQFRMCVWSRTNPGRAGSKSDAQKTSCPIRLVTTVSSAASTVSFWKIEKGCWDAVSKKLPSDAHRQLRQVWEVLVETCIAESCLLLRPVSTNNILTG